MFDDDKRLQSLIREIKEAIVEGFFVADKYAKTFDKYQQFFAENEALNLDTLKAQEHGMC